jgi:hypothetical protein
MCIVNSGVTMTVAGVNILQESYTRTVTNFARDSASQNNVLGNVWRTKRATIFVILILLQHTSFPLSIFVRYQLQIIIFRSYWSLHRPKRREHRALVHYNSNYRATTVT